MDKGKFIEDLTPGKPFTNCVFAVSDAEVKIAKNGNPYVQMVLSDRTGHRPAKRFQATEDEQAALCQSRLVVADGTVDDNPDFVGHIKIAAFTPVAEHAVDLDLFLPPLDPGTKAHHQRFSKIVQRVSDPALARLLRTAFHKDKPIWKRFKRAVAAKDMHHAKPGGLVEHTVEVAELCIAMCEILPGIRRDLVVTGAIFHDIGKLEELNHGLHCGSYTVAGNLLGHTVIGAQMVDGFIRELDDFPETLRLALIHLILSHHGVPEYGAVREPAMMEAQVLHQCDLISARAYQHREAEAQASPGQNFASARGIKTKLFIGDCGISASNQNAPIEDVFDLTEQTPILSFTTNVKRLIVQGRVAAGDPGRSSEEPEEEREVVPPEAGADYLLRVTGDSMRDVGIVEGDLVFVRDHAAPRNGEIVVAVQPGHGEVIKTYRDRDDAGQKTAPWLHSENPAYAPIPITEETRIQGKVTGLLRDF